MYFFFFFGGMNHKFSSMEGIFKWRFKIGIIIINKTLTLYLI